MCRMFYIGANRPLSSVDQTNQVPDLGVTQIIGEVETCVRSVIAYPFLYYTIQL